MTDNDTEWRAAVAELTEVERAQYDDPMTYADLLAADGTRL
ncbi:hypothetical protein ACDT10_21710 [Mycobacterium intracellulare]